MITFFRKAVISLVALFIIQGGVFADERRNSRRYSTPKRMPPRSQHPSRQSHPSRPAQPSFRSHPGQRFDSRRPAPRSVRQPPPVYRERRSVLSGHVYSSQHRHDYYRPGYKLRYLPHGSFRFHIGELDYFFFDGFFYRPYSDGYFVVDAPIGAVVLSLPRLHFSFSLNGITYFRTGDTYYRRHHPRGYIVVPDPGYRGYWR